MNQFRANISTPSKEIGVFFLINDLSIIKGAQVGVGSVVSSSNFDALKPTDAEAAEMNPDFVVIRLFLSNCVVVRLSFYLEFKSRL